MSKLLTDKQVVQIIRRNQGDKKIADYAAELKISEVWLRLLLRTDLEEPKLPGPKVLEQLGFKRVFRYEAKNGD